jgi:hypothetical protein
MVVTCALYHQTVEAGQKPTLQAVSKSKAIRLMFINIIGPVVEVVIVSRHKEIHSAHSCAHKSKAVVRALDISTFLAIVFVCVVGYKPIEGRDVNKGHSRHPVSIFSCSLVNGLLEPFESIVGD